MLASDMVKPKTTDKNFWTALPRPIMAMAPMANVTDAAFRRMFAELGAPDVFWTEFVSVEGLLSRGQEKLLVDFWKSPAERPIVAQIFGSKPEQFEEAPPRTFTLAGTTRKAKSGRGALMRSR